jgi:CheY-like chemotaxis protein
MLTQDRASAQEAGLPPSVEGTAPGAAGSKRILIAEDNAANRLMITRQMKRLGLAADVVDGGAAALTAIEKHDYGILFTDCMMPGIDGFELTARIREAEIGSGRRLPIVALTANAMTHQVDACFAAGMDGCLAKPVSLEELRKITHDFLVAPDETGEPQAHEPAAAGDGTANVLDLPALAEIFGEVNEATYGLLTMFLDTTKPLLAQLRQHLASGEHGAAQAAAHSAAGAARTAAAAELAEVCTAIEQSLQRGDKTGAAARAGELDPILARLEAAIDSLTGGRG